MFQAADSKSTYGQIWRRMQEMSLRDPMVHTSNHEALLNKVLHENFAYFHDITGFEPILRNNTDLVVTNPFNRVPYAFVQQKDSALTEPFTKM